MANWLSNLQDDLDFLLRKEVSLRFKILNILSGDKLRNNLAVAMMALHDVKPYVEDSTNGDFFFLRAKENFNDIWKI